MVKKKLTDNVKDKQATKITEENKEGQEKPTEQKDAVETAGVQAPETGEKQSEAKSDSGQTVTAEKSPEEKMAEMQDRYLRLSAEFDNYRKRTLREKIEITKYASQDLILKILPIMDDFERALKHIDSSEGCEGIREGINLIYSKFSDFLKQEGVREIESLNCEFNVDLHDAVAKVQVDDEGKKGRIVDVVQKGYFLQDKVIRHSKVVVGE